MRLSPRQHHYLQALGIDVYKIRNTEHTGPGRQGTDLKSVPASTPAAGVIEQDNAVSAGGIAPQTENGDVAGWEELQRKVAECRLCGLYEGRTQTVFGVGDVKRWCDRQAPAQEDRRGGFVAAARRMPCCRRSDSPGSRCSSPTS